MMAMAMLIPFPLVFFFLYFSRLLINTHIVRFGFSVLLANVPTNKMILDHAKNKVDQRVNWSEEASIRCLRIRDCFLSSFDLKQ